MSANYYLSVFFTAAAAFNAFCMVINGQVIPLLHYTSNLEDFPIYRDLPMLQIVVFSTNSSPYPVSVE